MCDLFTIGYANKSLNEFIEILKNNNIDCIVDVRSIPYSKQYPQYDYDKISKTLSDNNIKYLNFKYEFGARRTEPELYTKLLTYDDNIIEVVDFKKIWNNNIFLNGVTRIKNGLAKNYNICFMCSEKYFYECHRGVMLSEFFYRKEHINIIHLIDLNTKYLHNTIEKKAKLYFEELKNKFLLQNSQYLLYGEGLITNYSLNNSNIDYWKEFFEEYSYDKGYWLLNLKIGYKKGEDENE